MRPGWIWATQYSTLPLPLPMRTSIGFLVIGLSGNTRIHILPPRLTWRLMERRPASIWRAVTCPVWVALRPNSPKLTALPFHDRPSLRPLCILRYLVRLGCSMVSPSPRDHGADRAGARRARHDRRAANRPAFPGPPG